MNIRTLQSPNDLASLRPDWELMTADSPFTGWPWLESWWESYGEGRTLLLVVVEDDKGNVIGLAPWFIDRTLGGHVIRFLGSGEVCSDYLSLLASPEWEGEVASALADWLLGLHPDSTQDSPPHWDRLCLEGIDARDTLIPAFSQCLADKGCRLDQRPGPSCWRITLPETWELYLERHSKSHRKQIRRAERRMLDSEFAQFHTAVSPEQLEQGWEILVDLHQRRRQSLGQEGCFSSPQFSQFLHTAAERLLASEQLELHWIEWKGKPIAAEFHIARGEITYAYQAGVDPEALDLEPGRLINIATLKRAIAQGKKGFDFLRGNEPYKAHWRAEPRPSLSLQIIPPRVSAQIRHGFLMAGQEMKGWVKSGFEAIGLTQPQEA